MARNIDIFATKAKGQYIYQQYQSAEWLKQYSAFIDEYIQKTYFSALQEMWDTMNVAESLHAYLTFYTKWLFGLYRPLGGAAINEYYDIGLLYDNGKIFDDSQNADGLIQGNDYLKYIKFIYDYTYETWSVDYIIKFVADYCNVSETDIGLDYSYPNEIRITMPPTNKTQDFVKLVINYYDEMCLPYPAILNFVVRDENDKLWQGLYYNPYNPVFNRFYSDKKHSNTNYTISYDVDDVYTRKEVIDGGVFNQYHILYDIDTPYTRKSEIDNYVIDYEPDILYNNKDTSDEYVISYVKDNRFYDEINANNRYKVSYYANNRFNKQISQTYQWNKLKFN